MATHKGFGGLRTPSAVAAIVALSAAMGCQVAMAAPADTCTRYYCLAGAPCGIPLPRCAFANPSLRSHVQQQLQRYQQQLFDQHQQRRHHYYEALGAHWLRLHVDGAHVVGMAPAVSAGTDFELDLGVDTAIESSQRCMVYVRVQRPDEDIPTNACLAANNVSDDFLIRRNC